VVLNPGVRVPETHAASDRGSLAIKAAFQGRRVVLSVCRIVERKGLDLLIKAMSHLVGQHPDLLLVVAGSGPYRAELERLVESQDLANHVDFLGEVSESMKWSLYAACEFFVMPNRLLHGSDWEGFGIVFLEAAVAGKPAIGGNNGGVPDAIVDGETGFLVDTDGDEGPTLSAMRCLLQDEALRRAMGQAARRRALEQFSWEATASRFLTSVDQAFIDSAKQNARSPFGR
jgi:phosphatidylinositol alpha-1,6-mannosyltransferase